MVRRNAQPMEKTAPPVDDVSICTPEPPGTLHVTLTTLAQGAVLHRVHQNKYQAGQFNSAPQGNARFSPIRNEQGNVIPILYGGTTADCALMETVFHDVPYTAGFKSFDKGKLTNQIHSTIEVTQRLRMVDLANVHLRKLGVTRKQLIDPEKNQYPATRKWAEAIYRQCPQVQGLSWISRQDDSARAVVLFGDRIPAGAIRSRGESRSLVDDPDIYDAVLDLAERIGVRIVPGKS